MSIINSYRNSYSIYMNSIDRSEVYVSDLQKRVDSLSQETSTAGTSEYYADIPNARLFIDRENRLSSVQIYRQNMTAIKSRQEMLNQTNAATLKLAQNLHSQIQNQTSSSPIQDVGFQTVINQMRQDLTISLREQFNGEYILSGQATGIAPTIDLTTMGQVNTGAPPDYSYYKGDSSIIVEMLDDSRTLTYAPTAASGGYEKLIRSLNLCLNADPSTPGGIARLQEASTLSQTAMEEITGIQQQVSANINYINETYDELSIEEKKNVEDIKAFGYRDQLDAWMEYYNRKGELELVRTHWIESVRSTTQLIDSIRY